MGNDFFNKAQNKLTTEVVPLQLDERTSKFW